MYTSPISHAGSPSFRCYHPHWQLLLLIVVQDIDGQQATITRNTLERVAPSFGGWYSIGFITLLILVFGGVVSTPAGWTLSLGGTLTYPFTGGPSSKLPQNGRIPTYPGARDRCATPCEGGACTVVIGWSRAPAGGHTNASPAPAKSNRVGQGRPRSHSHYSDYS